MTFQWAQLYGPDRTPRTQATMLLVSEPRPGLLRLTSLDRFDGLRFLRSSQPPGSTALDVPPAAASRWVENATVEVEGLRSTLLASGGGLATPACAGSRRSSRRSASRRDGTTLAQRRRRGAGYEVVSY